MSALPTKAEILAAVRSGLDQDAAPVPDAAPALELGPHVRPIDRRESLLRQREQRLRRREQRVAFDYRAASTRDHNERWKPINKHPDRAALGAVDRIRARSRDVARNTALGSSFLERLEDDIIGDAGLRPVARAVKANGELHKTFNAQVEALLADFWDVCDIRRVHDFAGLQRQALRCWQESGACLVHMPLWTADADIPIPLQFMGIEPDYLDATTFSTRDPNIEIRHGIELDRTTHRIRAFHVRESTDMGIGVKSKRIPADQCAYLFTAERWDQVVGLPRLGPVVGNIYDLEDYVTSEVLRAREHAKRSQAIKTDNPKQRMAAWTRAGQAPDPDGDGEIDERIEDVAFGRLYLRTGEEIVELGANVPPSNFKDFMTYLGRWTAVGLGTSYEDLTGDHTDTHFSASRATHVRDVRHKRKLQGLIEWMLGRRLYERICYVGVLSGHLNAVDRPRFLEDASYRRRMLRCRWRRSGFALHDPEKDIRYWAFAIALGIATREQACAFLGQEWEEVVEQLVAEEQTIKDKKLRALCMPGDFSAGLVDYLLGTPEKPPPAATTAPAKNGSNGNGRLAGILNE